MIGVFGQINDGCLSVYGGQVTINGIGSFNAIVNDAEVARIQQYLDENEWRYPAFQVCIETAALPYLIEGAELVNLQTGWKSVFRRIMEPGMMGNTDLINIITVSIPR